MEVVSAGAYTRGYRRVIEKSFIPNRLQMSHFVPVDFRRGRAEILGSGPGGRPSGTNFGKGSGWGGQAIHSLAVCPFSGWIFPPTRP